MKITNRRSLKSKEKTLCLGTGGPSTKSTIVQTLLPLGLDMFCRMMRAEVKEITSQSDDESLRYRWGKKRGWIYLGDQKVHVNVQRVRDDQAQEEVPLRTYRELQDPHIIDDQILKKVLMGLSQRRYDEAALKIPETFGIKPSSVSRRFIRASAKKLEELMNRDLSRHDCVAIVMDGKYFAEADMIVAVGVTLNGDKIILGFIESGSENQRVVEDFLRGLIGRGLSADREILFVIDGSLGLHKGIENVFKEKAIFQRCQWHKTENVVSYLPKRHQEEVKRKMRQAYANETYEEVKRNLLSLRKELILLNQSAVNSLDEGLEETLTLHRLGVFKDLGISLRTTNMIESVFGHVEQFTGRVDCWKNSSQRQRWLAASLLEIEKRLKKVKGHKHLPKLRWVMEAQSQQMQSLCA